MDPDVYPYFTRVLLIRDHVAPFPPHIARFSPYVLDILRG